MEIVIRILRIYNTICKTQHNPRAHELTNCRLELGAGGGLVGLAVALACDLQHPLILSDMEVMYELMKQNIALNEVSSKVEPLILNWYALIVPSLLMNIL